MPPSLSESVDVPCSLAPLTVELSCSPGLTVVNPDIALCGVKTESLLIMPTTVLLA